MPVQNIESFFYLNCGIEEAIVLSSGVQQSLVDERHAHLVFHAWAMVGLRDGPPWPIAARGGRGGAGDWLVWLPPAEGKLRKAWDLVEEVAGHFQTLSYEA